MPYLSLPSPSMMLVPLLCILASCVINICSGSGIQIQHIIGLPADSFRAGCMIMAQNTSAATNLYIGTMSTPAYVIKVSLQNNTVSGSVSFPSESSIILFSAGVIDPSETFGYFFTAWTSTAIKVRLSDMTLDTTIVIKYGFGDLKDAFSAPGSPYMFILGIDHDTSFVGRIPYNNFTYEGTESLSLPIFNNDTGIVKTGCADPITGNIYVATDGNRSVVFQIDMDHFNITDTFTLPYGAVVGSLCDSAHGFLYLYTNLASSGQLYQIGLTPSLRMNGSLFLSQYDQDVVGGALNMKAGHAYLGTSRGRVLDVSLPGFLQQEGSLLASNASLGPGIMHPRRNQAYFAHLSDPRVYVVQLPPPCPSDCNGKGTCDYGTCQCAPGWSGQTCDSYSCTNDCNGFGVCNNGKCTCDSSHKGLDCSIPTCPNECSGHGKCDTTTYTCTCDTGYTGASCSGGGIGDCASLSLGGCSQCLRNESCGWCADSAGIGGCYEIDASGPYPSGPYGLGCSHWHHSSCPVPYFNVLPWILSALFWLLLLVNVVSIMIEDITIPPNDGKNNERYIQSSVRRALRSGKAWGLLDHFQIVAVSGQLSLQFPTIYTEFVDFFRWSTLHHALPWSRRVDLGQPTGRNLLSFEQFFVYSLVPSSSELMWGNLFWFVVVGVVVMLPFALMFIVRCCVPSSHKANVSKHLQNRPVYVLVRLVLFGLVGLTVTSAYVLRDGVANSINRASFGVGLVTAVVVSIIIPAAALLILNVREKELFKRDYRMRFGALFMVYYFKKSRFVMVQVARKIFLGLVVGLLTGQPVAQLVLLILAQVAYLIGILVAKPFLDHIHFFVEGAVSCLYILMFLLMFVFLPAGMITEFTSRESTQFGIAIFIIIIHIVVSVLHVGGFFDSWARMRNIYTFKQFKKELFGREANKEISLSARG
eukprot:TRINITY_DN1776_c0_g1_i2.p1 TRINITY_DN1776_c0_g1~~TRINITY_DN1776_c0_g1_i2.p1  ORF type:complete len:927 (-),score=209.62 TRINITY_DN1776_c0_g1_i2:41-2821(-)